VQFARIARASVGGSCSAADARKHWRSGAGEIVDYRAVDVAPYAPVDRFSLIDRATTMEALG
jgi:hypothetical protein